MSHLSMAQRVLVEFGGNAADLRRGDFEATDLLDDRGALPRIGPVDIQFSDGDRHRPLAADACSSARGWNGRP